MCIRDSLHLSSRPDAWRQWYGANNYLYGPQAAGGPRYELFTICLLYTSRCV